MMGGGGTDWLTPVLVLSVGLVAGIILAITLTRSRRSSERTLRLAPEEIRDLLAEKDALISRLRELEVTAAGRSPEQIAVERYQLELAAAKVWRELDRAERSRAESAPAPAQAPAASGSRWASAAVWVGGVGIFTGALVFALLNATSDRAPGGSLTGNTGIGPTGPMGQGDQPDPALHALMARVAENPGDHEAHLDLAQAFIYREQLVEAFQVVQAANAIQPGHARALTYEAVVRQAMGMSARAMELLDAAVEKDPQLAEAWVRRGLAAFETGQWQKAIDSWEHALKVRPDGQSALGPVIEEARKRLAGGGEDEAPAPAPAPAHQQPAPSEDGAVKLVVDLAPEAKGQMPPGATLFVYARPAGVKAGPPIAAKRIPVGTGFPIELSLGPSDSMMGQPFPIPAMIEARLDSDGNAMTRDPSDPRAAVDQVSPGGDTVRLVLRVE